MDVLPTLGAAPLTESEFRALRELIRDRSGITLSDAKSQLVASRLARRLRAHGLTSYGAYYELVTRHDPDGFEMRELLNAMTTNKTDFFREKHHFDFLREMLVPQLLQGAQGDPRIRIWSAGCSSGEEPYTIAMTVLAALPAGQRCAVEVLATDLDTQVLARAAEGVYSDDAVAPVPEDLQRRFLRRGTGANAGKVRVADELRQVVQFRQLNFVERPWPVPGSFDAIFCRNVLIYFDGARQRDVVTGFAERIRPGGCLFIGHSETLTNLNELFEPLRGTVYRRRASGDAVSATPAPAAPARAATPARPGPAPAEPTIPVVIGGVRASRDGARLRTLLGSCVCACLFDPVARVGGINHFMLPDGLEDHALPTRYGVNAMEVLINAVLKQGGDRRRLQAKAFGAAHVLAGAGLNPDVPRRNARFIKTFLEKEGIPLVSSRLGGSAPVEVIFATDTGRALVRALGQAQARDLAIEESRHDLEVRRDLTRVPAGSVELF
jgi:chemotaxis protein methyltransferase CheR